MIGNPYCLSNEVRQYQIFNVDWTTFKQIRLIQSFVKFSLSSIENPKNEEIIPPDIFISDIESI